jgi:hypothetical protein
MLWWVLYALSIMALMFSAIWWISERGYEPLITGITGLAAVIALHIEKSKAQKRKSSRSKGEFPEVLKMPTGDQVIDSVLETRLWPFRNRPSAG